MLRTPFHYLDRNGNSKRVILLHMQRSCINTLGNRHFSVLKPLIWIVYTVIDLAMHLRHRNQDTRCRCFVYHWGRFENVWQVLLLDVCLILDQVFPHISQGPSWGIFQLTHISSQQWILVRFRMHESSWWLAEVSNILWVWTSEHRMADHGGRCVSLDEVGDL